MNFVLFKDYIIFRITNLILAACLIFTALPNDLLYANQTKNILNRPLASNAESLGDNIAGRQAKNVRDNFSIFQELQVQGSQDNRPIDVYFKQISLRFIDPAFNPAQKGYDSAMVSCRISALGGIPLPEGAYKLVYYDGRPLFIEFQDKTIIPLAIFDISYSAGGTYMDRVYEIMAKSYPLICNYFKSEPCLLYDFAPRWLSKKGCSSLGLKSLIVFQGVLSVLEDMGEDVRYEGRPDNSIPKGIDMLLKTVKPNQRLLIYGPGSGSEAVRLALNGVYVTAFCTSELEKMNVLCNARLNGVDLQYLRVISSFSDNNERFDFAYCNAPRPIYPDKTGLFMYFELDKRKFDREGETTKEFLGIAQESISENGKVICVGPDVPIYHKLIYESGFVIEKAVSIQTGGDLAVFVISKSKNQFLGADSATLFTNTVDHRLSGFIRQQSMRGLEAIYSDLSVTGIDRDIPVGDYDYFGDLMAFIPDRLVCYSFINILLKTRQYMISRYLPSTHFENLVKKIDDALLEYEARLVSSPSLSDPYTAQGLSKIAHEAVAISGKRTGIFVKEDKLKWMLRINPPQNLMSEYKTSTVEGLLSIMDIQSVFSLGRYIEPPEWSYKNYDLYSRLESDDFKERPVRVIIFEQLPGNLVKYFKEKLPFSHDKIAGTLTGFPVRQSDKNKVPRLRALSRALHYLHELNFYSEMISARFSGKIEDNKTMKEAFETMLDKKADIKQFFEPHALVETLFWKEALDDLENSAPAPFPEELKGLPFSMIIQEGGELKITSIIDRITALSKGRDSTLHSRRYLRLDPLVYYFKDVNIVERVLIVAYTFPEFITLAMKFGFSGRNIKPVDIEAILADYDLKVGVYLNMAGIPGMVLDKERESLDDTEAIKTGFSLCPVNIDIINVFETQV